MNLAAVTETVDDIDTGDVPSEVRDAGEAENVQPSEPSTRARPRPVPISRPVDPSVPISKFGGVPQGVTHWRIKRQVLGGGWEALSHAEAGAIAAVRQWPLAELEETTVRDRWGAGRYQVLWVKPTPGGGSMVLRGGQQFEILAPPVAPASPAASSSPTSFGPEVDRTLQMMRMISTEADAKMSSVLQFAAALAGRQNNGFGAAELELIMRNNREATAAAVSAAVAPLQAELATMRRELDGDGEDDAPSLAGAAASAGVGLLKGKGALSQAANFAAGNPELVKAVLPVVADAFSKIVGLFAPKEAPPPPRRAIPIAPPVAPPTPVQAAPAPPPAAPPAPVAETPAPPPQAHVAENHASA